MMIVPIIFCTIVLGIGSVGQGRERRQGRAHRLGLLPADVDVRAGDRPGRGQRPAPGFGHEPRPGGGVDAAQETAAEAGAPHHGRLPARHHPGEHGVRVHRRLGAAGPARGAARRLRPAEDGHGRRADPARHRASAAAGLPDPRDDHVGGADRRVRGDRGRGRRDRLGRAEEPRGDHVRLLRDLPAVRRLRARHGPVVRRPRQHLQPAALPRQGVPADRVDVLVGVGAAAADREDGAPGREQARRRHHRAHRLLVQPGRHRDLPDDGDAVHRHRAGRAARHRRADLAAASS